ncbi:hypothetical protein QYF61_004505, partial [Mycteria americana]
MVLKAFLKSRILNSTISWSLQPRLPLTFTSPMSPSLLDTVGPFGCQGTLLTHIELTINQTPQILFCRAILQPLVPPSLYVHPGLHRPSTNVSRCLCKASLPSRKSMAPPNLVLPANLLSVHSTPVSRLLIKTLKRTGPKIEPWGTPL